MANYTPTNWNNLTTPAINATNLNNIETGIQENMWYGFTTNLVNAYMLSLTPAPSTYYDGMRIIVKANADSTNDVTINVNGLGEKNIKNINNTNFSSFKANMIYTIIYNGTDFILQNSISQTI